MLLQAELRVRASAAEEPTFRLDADTIRVLHFGDPESPWARLDGALVRYFLRLLRALGTWARLLS